MTTVHLTAETFTDTTSRSGEQVVGSAAALDMVEVRALVPTQQST